MLQMHQTQFLTVSSDKKDKIVKSKYPLSMDAPPVGQLIGSTQQQLTNNGFTRKITLYRGYYRTVEELIPNLNMYTKNIVKFHYDKLTRSVSFTMKVKNHSIHFGNGLDKMLGFQYQSYSTDSTVTAEHTPSLHAGMQSLFIYCSIAGDTNVANVKVPLLRTVRVPVKAEFGEVIHFEYKNRFYVPVNTNYISSVDIDMRNEMGGSVHFVEGKTLLVVHFQRVR